MQLYLEKKVETFTDLDQYCYYVAGTVGGFLTDLLLLKGSVNDRDREKLKDNFIDAGIFLQKVNIIRDIKNDLKNRQKHYWPLKSLNIEEEMLRQERYKEQVLPALNDMIRNVKKHILGLAEYLEALPNQFPGYRRFFAVNNTLGLATLKLMKDNPDVIYGGRKVKVAKINFMRILKNPEKHFQRLLKEDMM